jgi:hypothetical protein
MAHSSAPPAWSDHNVSDPGVTLLQVLAYTLGAGALVAASVAVFRSRRRSGEPKVAKGALPIGPILNKSKAVVRPLLERVRVSPSTHGATRPIFVARQEMVAKQPTPVLAGWCPVRRRG